MQPYRKDTMKMNFPSLFIYWRGTESKRQVLVAVLFKMYADKLAKDRS